ncbi:MAG TPA: O-antigen ligase family protein [Myxococcota bacterium]|nr:O-antigen ligase family protein [Myxococcota bacterium]HRY93004.1 O-antigen ligase family protein [Myxococcota bacterium]HSA21956.1 O-antigen ligase family protein [Myxococcota bacterium]
MSAAPAALHAARWLAAAVAAAALLWWPWTDRLDLPKQAALLLVALGACAWGFVRRRPWPVDALGAGLALAALLGLALAPAGAGARVEGWAGWLAAVMLVALARRAAGDPAGPAALTGLLARLAVGLYAVAWLQALGAPLFNSQLAGFQGRRVVGTLGGPGHLGWVLALLLPWVGAELQAAQGRARHLWRLALALCAGALVLSGSRTAWAMALAGLPFWLRRPALVPALVCLLAGGLGAVGLDQATQQARLGARAADLAAPAGTARGRLYLWRVHLSALPALAGPGLGPEGFQRAWPAWQAAFLADHPDQAGFCTDARHAHADPIEVLADFGLPGLLLLLALLGLGLARAPPPGGARRGPAQAALVSAAVGGLAAPILFFAPSLALGALALGLRLGPVRRPVPAWLGVGLLLGLAAAGALLGARLSSELPRSQATLARIEGRPAEARAAAARALALDGRNPRAWLELAAACQAAGDGACVARALEESARDLPPVGCPRATPPGPTGAQPGAPGPRP